MDSLKDSHGIEYFFVLERSITHQRGRDGGGDPSGDVRKWGQEGKLMVWNDLCHTFY